MGRDYAKMTPVSTERAIPSSHRTKIALIKRVAADCYSQMQYAPRFQLKKKALGDDERKCGIET